MPALVLCGNRTFVAGDDLRTFTFFAILLRIIQIIALIKITIFAHGSFRIHIEISDECAGSGKIETLVDQSTIILTAYFCSGFVTALLGILLEFGICMTSARGTPVQTEQRKCLQPLCHIKIVPMSILRLANMAMGIMLIRILRQVCYCGGRESSPYIICPRLDALHGWLAILVGSHFMEAAVAGLMGIYFFFKKSQGRFPSMFVSAESRWQCCCRCCCTFASVMTCCLFGGRDGKTGDFADIAIILADYFDDGGTLDVVASDIVIGLRVLARVQNQKEAECRVELKRRVSFVASIKQGQATGEMRANVAKLQEDLGLSEVQETKTGSPEKLRLAQFADEELGEAPNKDPSDNQVNSEVDDGNIWTGSIRLGDDGTENVVIEGGRKLPSQAEPTEQERPPVNSAILSDELQVIDEVVALIEDQDGDNDDFDDAVCLTRVGSEKTFRRKAITYNLHRTRGLLHYKPAVREVLSRKNEKDKLAIAEGARFMRFAAGVYYFRRYNAQRRSFEVCCAIGEKGKACFEKGIECVNRCHNMTKEMAGSDFLDLPIGFGYQIGQLMEARFLALAGLDMAEIKYVQFGEGVARTPYSIAIDHAWKSVVIVIRGTEGLDDVVADLRMVPVSMKDCGIKCGFDGGDFFVHAGMLACAEWIYDDLGSHGIVDKLLSEPQHEGYKLRLTGHSLGAGTSAILSFMMRVKYPDLRCSCFCPPGCSMSENMAEECKPYLTSYVLDHDIVPRISLTSLENLRNDMLDMIVRLKVTKFQATHAKPEVGKDMLLHRQDSIPPSEFKEQLDEFHNQRDAVMAARNVRTIPLCPPGNIVQLVKTTDDAPLTGCCSSGSVVEDQHSPCAARWAHVSDFAEIIISSHFLDDHSSPNVLKALEDTANVFGLSSPFTVQENKPSSDASPPRRRASLATSLWRRK